MEAFQLLEGRRRRSKQALCASFSRQFSSLNARHVNKKLQKDVFCASNICTAALLVVLVMGGCWGNSDRGLNRMVDPRSFENKTASSGRMRTDTEQIASRKFWRKYYS